MTLELVPITLADAQAFVAAWHRHNDPPIGHRYSIGVTDDGTLVGVAIVSNPRARAYMDGRTLEVIRTATDGTPHANSKLYAACWTAAKALGYRRLITYTQHDETGSSLKAAGWRIVAVRPPRPGWDGSSVSRPRKHRGTGYTQRTLWETT